METPTLAHEHIHFCVVSSLTYLGIENICHIAVFIIFIMDHEIITYCIISEVKKNY